MPPRSSQPPPPRADAREDLTLMRQVRLVKPHLAPTGFRTDKWETVARAVNREIGARVWRSGNGARGRYGHLLAAFKLQRRSLPAELRDRIVQYISLLRKRGYSGTLPEIEEEEGGQKEGGEEDMQQAEGEDEEEGTEENEVEEAMTHLAAGESELELAHGPPIDVRIEATLEWVRETVTAVRAMAEGLLQVIEKDHAARRDEAERVREDRQELLAVVRLALQRK